jgi:hypothetical protein
MKNRSLMEGEEGNGGEDAPPEGNEVDGPPAKRARKGPVALDPDEAAFASSLHPLRPTPDAMSQDKNMDRQDGDGDGEESDKADHDVDMEGRDGNGEYDQGVGFQDNGVCSQLFSMKLLKLIIHS